MLFQVFGLRIGRGEVCQLDTSVISLSTAPFQALLDYDNRYFPADHEANQAIFLDAPEINEDAMRLVKSKNMNEVFGCARMYFGGTPYLPDKNTYGITSFELG